jgi:hypothetical protein
MKYMLMMNCPRDGYDQFTSWPKKDIEAHIAFMAAFSKKLHASGEWVDGQGLDAPTQAKCVRAGKGTRRRAIQYADRGPPGHERAA